MMIDREEFFYYSTVSGFADISERYKLDTVLKELLSTLRLPEAVPDDYNRQLELLGLLDLLSRDVANIIMNYNADEMQ